MVPKKGVQISAIKDLEEDVVPLKAMLGDEAFLGSKAELPVAMGVDIFNKVKVFDLADAPHLLIAGATKQADDVLRSLRVKMNERYQLIRRA